MGALSRLSLKSNYLRPDGGKALAEGLKGNQAITELNIADSQLGFRGDMSGIIALADVIPDMRALSKLIFGGDYDINTHTRPEPATLEVGMTEANFSYKKLGAGGACIISAWITHKDKGALSKLDLSMNRIPATQAGMLNATCKAKGVDLAL
jgi:hypothetical protein